MPLHASTEPNESGKFVEDFTMDRNFALEAVRVTEFAALAASRLMGRGDEKAADQAAVDAMRRALNSLDIDGKVVIGEGERDEAHEVEPAGDRRPDLGHRRELREGREGRPGRRHLELQGRGVLRERIETRGGIRQARLVQDPVRDGGHHLRRRRYR